MAYSSNDLPRSTPPCIDSNAADVASQAGKRRSATAAGPALSDRLERFIAFEPMSGCWLWTGTSSRKGYGGFDRRGAHRVAYETLRGPIPVGLTLDHLCRTPACVNPDHLEPVTMQINVLRGTGPTAINARATSCPKGHPYDPANTVVYFQAGSIHRRCRTCKADQLRESAIKRSARRLASGLCVRCGKQSLTSTHSCTTCLADTAKRVAAAKSRRRALKAYEVRP